ncbi:MAG TPA: arsenate reductase ArsC [Terracidiphilus sp.]|jgi:arsenate reductase
MANPYNVLFLCADNSARSIMAEALLNHKSGGRFKAYSGGSQPATALHEEALAELTAAGIGTEDLKSKSWDEFSPQRDESSMMDFIFMLCAGNEGCPTWPHSRVTAKWDIPDPAVKVGSSEEIARRFHEVLRLLDSRINLLLALQDSELKEMALELKGKEIEAA